MKTLSLTIVLFCWVIVGCEEPVIPDDSQLQQAGAIKGSDVEITADVGHAVFDRPITITTRCLPLVTGKGFVSISSEKDKGQFTWHLLSPLTDTTTKFQDPDYWITIPAEFKANETFEQRWTVQLVRYSTDSHLFTADVYVDSIFIADSNRMYGIRSDVARKHCRSQAGWDPYGVSSRNVYLRP